MDKRGAKDYACRSVKIGAMSREYLERLIREDRIRVPMRDQSEPLEEVLRRVHARDSYELEEARRRAQGLARVEDQGGWLRIEG